MKENPLVSIIVPCYNHEKFIAETIESAYNSSYQNLEVIIVNDGSKDNSEQVVRLLQKKYHKLVYVYQENGGPASARNHGIKIAKGKYVLPLDADDLISPDYIQKCVEILESNQSVKLVYCNAEFFGERTGPWNLKPYKPESLALDNMIFCSAVYRKSDWESVGGYEEQMTWGWEDWEFWISLLSRGGEVVKLPVTGFYYRVNKNSRRKSTDKEAKKKTIDLINNKHRHFIHKHLKGPLHYQRSWSKEINIFKRIFRL